MSPDYFLTFRLWINILRSSLRTVNNYHSYWTMECNTMKLYLSTDGRHGTTNSCNTKHNHWYDETNNLDECHPVCEERPEHRQHLVCEERPEHRQHLVCEEWPKYWQHLVCKEWPKYWQHLVGKEWPKYWQYLVCEERPKHWQHLVCKEWPKRAFPD